MSIRDLHGLLAHLEIDEQRMREKDAVGWVVVCVDDESNSHVHATGLFPTPEAAFIHAGERHNEDVRLNPGEPLWTYHVLPLFKP